MSLINISAEHNACHPSAPCNRKLCKYLAGGVQPVINLPSQTPLFQTQCCLNRDELKSI